MTHMWTVYMREQDKSNQTIEINFAALPHEGDEESSSMVECLEELLWAMDPVVYGLPQERHSEAAESAIRRFRTMTAGLLPEDLTATLTIVGPEYEISLVRTLRYVHDVSWAILAPARLYKVEEQDSNYVSRYGKAFSAELLIWDERAEIAEAERAARYEEVPF